MATKKKSKSNAELNAENKFLRRQRTAGSVASVINNLIKWAGLSVICYCGYLSIEALAGQNTAADVGVSLLADVELSEVFAVLFGGGGIGYGWRQASLRKSTTERLQERIKKLEEAIDPSRTSSGLTPMGNTHPLDE